MSLTALTALSPVDGRYVKKTRELVPYFSEYGLIRYRVRVEVEYFLALVDLGLAELEGLPADALDNIRALADDFTETDAEAIKSIERQTNHDVKAVEYWMKERFADVGLQRWAEFIHFGLTSQDINNTAMPMAVKAASRNVYQPAVRELIQRLTEMADQWGNVPMLARTHGQPASPTKLGKELRVFADRLDMQFAECSALPHSGKFGGATGNFNAHHVAYPDIDWPGFGNVFLGDYLGLERQQWTTQIEHYDGLAARFDAMRRINVILLDLCKDLWQYIAMDYFKQRIAEGEVGSSAMPHKVNPIDFENAEGNLGMANALFGHMAEKLPISRLQRDLTDSTVSRNFGIPYAHTLIAIRSIRQGLDKLVLNPDALQADLDRNWAVLAEPIQTVLRRIGYPKPYETLKALTRTEGGITAASLHAFIEQLDIDEATKTQLLSLRPDTYTGMP